ncbi:hypothetical protein LX36DRAFT_367811 [Colletotrichum falcatum]|nr:hypothetical protein LX36DRAFT_367811 [Colletotrichum falcatum]
MFLCGTESPTIHFFFRSLSGISSGWALASGAVIFEVPFPDPGCWIVVLTLITISTGSNRLLGGGEEGCLYDLCSVSFASSPLYLNAPSAPKKYRLFIKVPFAVPRNSQQWVPTSVARRGLRLGRIHFSSSSFLWKG